MPAKDLTTTSVFAFDATELIKICQKQINALIEMQQELCNSLKEANQNLASRSEWERDVTVECTTKLLTAKAVPTQNSKSQINPGVSPTFRVLSRDNVIRSVVFAGPASAPRNIVVERKLARRKAMLSW